MNIQKPKIEDLQDVQNILSQWTEKEEIDKYIERITKEINGQTEYKMQFWVFKENEKALGVIGLSDPLPKILHLSKTEKPGEIKILYLDNKARGKGLGRALIEFLEREALQQEYQELLVRSAVKYKDTAYGFYEKMGYQKRGQVMGGEKSEQMQVFGKKIL